MNHLLLYSLDNVMSKIDFTYLIGSRTLCLFKKVLHCQKKKKDMTFQNKIYSKNANLSNMTHFVSLLFFFFHSSQEVFRRFLGLTDQHKQWVHYFSEIIIYMYGII